MRSGPNHQRPRRDQGRCPLRGAADHRTVLRSGPFLAEVRYLVSPMALQNCIVGIHAAKP